MKKVIFVCYGNICRSPLMALLAQARVTAEKLPIAVESAGLIAWSGHPATEPMIVAGGELGLDLSLHRARRFSSYQLDQADLVIAATRLQRDEIATTWPEYASRVAFLGELAGSAEDVEDPYLADAETYRRSAQTIQRMVEAAWPEIVRRLS